MGPLIPVVLAAGAGWYWWKHRTPAPVQAPPYQGPDGKVYPSPFMVDGNMPANIAQAVTQMIMLNNDWSNLDANAVWMMNNGYPIAAKLLADKANRIANPSTPATPAPVVSGSPTSIWLK